MGPKQVSSTLQSKWDNKLTQWEQSPKIKKIRKMLTFLTNYKNVDIDLSNVKLNRLVILNCLGFFKKKCIKFTNLLINNLTVLSLSTLFNKLASTLTKLTITFNRRHSEKEYSLGHFIYPLQNARRLREFVLISWVKAHTLLINCNILAKLLENCPIALFTLKNIELINVKGPFTFALSESKHLETFILQSSDQFSSQMVQQVYDALKTVPKLKVLSITDKYHHQMASWKEFSKLIKVSKAIERVELNGREIMYSGNEEAVEDCLSSNKSLKKIYLKDFEGVASALAITLIGRLHYSQVLRVLDISYFNIELQALVDAIAGLISTCPTLSKFIMAQAVDKDHPIIIPILESIEKSSSLSIIDMSQNIFAKEEIYQIAHIFKVCTSLKKIKLTSCNLTDEHLSDIFEMLVDNKTVTSIDLMAQQYDVPLLKCVGNLLKFLEGNSTVAELFLYGNCFADDKYYSIMSALSKNKGIVKFNIGFASEIIAKEAMEEFANVITNNTTLSDISIKVKKASIDPLLPFQAISFNKSLKILEICGTEFSCQSISALAHSLKTNNVLEVIKLDGLLAKGSATALTESLKCNTGVKYITLYHSGIVKNEALHFFDFLESNSTLQFLNIYSNAINIEEHHINLIIRMLLKSRKLKYLGMGKLGISKESIRLLKYIQCIVIGLTIDIF